MWTCVYNDLGFCSYVNYCAYIIIIYVKYYDLCSFLNVLLFLFSFFLYCFKRWTLEGSNVSYLIETKENEEVNINSLRCFKSDGSKDEKASGVVVNLWNDWQKFSYEHSVDVTI